MNPSNGCSINGPAAVCAGTINTHASTITPAGGTITHSWSITGTGTINGSTTGASVSVIAGAAGSYTLTDNFIKDGNPGSCTKTVTVNAIPTCSITGPDVVCASATNTYTSTVNPADGTITHSWSIIAGGSATISGSATGSSVNVIAGASGTYTVKDVITRNGCSSSCTKLVSIFVQACNITGATAVNPNSTNTYNSTGSESGATLSWAITAGGNGTISGASKSCPTVNVLAGASGSYTLVLTVTKNGCSKVCSKTVTISTCTITCPANIVVNNKPDYCGKNVTYPAATKTGTCGPLTYSKASGSWFPVGTTTVTVTSPSTGASCSFTVKVVDNQKPDINCPSNIVVNAPTNSCSKTISYTVSATDNCPGAITLTSVPASGTPFNTGTTTVVVTATDASGNTSTSSFTVTVKEYKAPVITCPPNITVDAAPGLCKALVNPGTATATDNCPGVITITGKRSDNKALNAYYPRA